jgi:alkylhydroperoxidase family enzyme
LAHIPYVPYEEAQGPLAELYRRYGGPEMKVDNIIRIHSLNPPSMEHHMQLYAHLMRGPSALSRIQREMIAVTVSGVKRTASSPGRNSRSDEGPAND